MKAQEVLRLAKACLQDDSLTERSVSTRRVCSLWSGMGSIYELRINNRLHVAVKHVPAANPKEMKDFGERRKAVAYQVEGNFYEHAAPHFPTLRLPQLYHIERSENSITLCLEWMSGPRYSSSSRVEDALTWLATLHSESWGRADALVASCGLHAQGTYWHLDTRPEEHAQMSSTGWEGRLKRAARAIHDALERDVMQCIVHGDVKEPNLLLDPDGGVTMCDFQYTGKGSPTQDLAYFFCSSVDTEECDEEQLLEHYHKILTQKLVDQSAIPSWDHLQLSMDLAYCDFCRFMSGWGYWGSVDIIQSRVQAVLNRIDNGKDLGSEEAYDAAIRNHFW
ncbi:hypothetical protein FisN_11Lh244 [Fistulifera solaris]|uniref:Protein kinase domain-containing protein n=1 Tax=Fistulifera solaris TaxID=1519565 RepID=A0A1Z5J722_FISSO|nr:hypothetical protein FisN_11Lh244 [Fistulifera solaris]|eukprot:GAX09783.1 hypothetical protein FisN_11Lh244 [Fistulifera solaris]